MEYESFKNTIAGLYERLDEASAALAAFPKLPNGLTPDVVRVTPEYQAAKKNYETVFGQVRRFNGLYLKRFRKELAADRRAKLAAKSS